MSGLVNKVKDALHSDKSHSSSTTHGTSTTGTTGTHGSTNAGPHSSNFANSADPRVDSDLDGSRNAGMNQTTGTGGYTSGTTGGIGGTTHGSTNAGPHSSNLANSADPRVDSDLDHSRNAGLNQTTGTTGTTGAGYGSSGIGSTGTHGTTGGYGTSSTTAGPHSSNVANKLDPRVDSDLDGSRNAGMNQHTNTAGGYGSSTTGTTGAGYGSSGIGGNTHSSSTTAGPHSSNLANKADPRVDSDLDRSRNAGLNQHTNTAGGIGSTGTHGTTTGTGGYGSSTTGTTGATGSAAEYASPGSGNSTNAGPHNSNLLNKLDPRVDSNLDGSKTTGGNKTYQ